MRIFSCAGGDVSLPDPTLVLVDRRDGGNLIVSPPRDVWERNELTVAELTQWSYLVAATGKAMLDVLPQLEDGCVNYWEAGNWALNDQAEPKGPKTAAQHRRVHLHLLGRSPAATSASWQWGEAPRFPDFAERHAWAADHQWLTRDECTAIAARAAAILGGSYAMDADPWDSCELCGYPTPIADRHACAPR